ncbi:MetQ/NlpA family ABC transporter substrate-binding protein [Bacillus sp. FJAT-42376]|uniref:methionine ABC transporter substrate-binding lipoprotein MetQ n=1 Tax=Bacillus sp. FJAT-42376 TaxID=2014076 RepID=UPI000F4F7662|nr:methionine ABC transporter substrate-binding lipoprotein MetQ [Bacillus sp. FJAT-42376]AZB44315.1 MetQ/NlpA family ABC transporter substrate-binding protein [Bacillus sp. FJAT-42376]
MKKLLLSTVFAFSAVALAACGTGGSNGSGEKTEKIVVGASNTPHAEILEEAKPLLEKKGVDLEIKTFQDYVLPNKTLASKELDANYFQHKPYLDLQMKENKDYDFVSAGAIHIEPMGVYSKKYKSLDELPEGSKVILSNSVAEHGRILTLLESKGLIKLKSGVDKANATLKDIAENPKNIKFEADVEPGLLPQIYNNDEGDAVVINTNYAIDAGLEPSKDAIAIEGSESPYANLIVVRKGDENKKAIKTLVEVLHSKEIQDFIKKEYKGAVVPVSE